MSEIAYPRFSGARLRKAREAVKVNNKPMTLLEFCRRLDFIITPGTLINYEHDRQVPNMNVAILMAVELKVKLTELIEGNRK